jgi:hypothetical protein
MIAGIIDALYGTYKPAVRLVWQHHENCANGARWWRQTDAEIAAALRLPLITVRRANAILKADGKIDYTRCKRRPTTFRMLQAYPDGCQRRRHAQPHLTPELTAHGERSTPELTAHGEHTLSPPDKNPTEEERDARARDGGLAPASPSPEAEQDILLVKEEEPASPPSAHKTPWPDEPPPEIVQLVLEAGYEPDELLEEIADWCRDRDRKSADWPAFTRRWVKRQKRFDADKGKERNGFIAKILEERGAAPRPAGGIVIDGTAEPPPPPRARAAPPYEPWKHVLPRAVSDEEPSRFQAPARTVAEQIAALAGGGAP